MHGESLGKKLVLSPPILLKVQLLRKYNTETGYLYNTVRGCVNLKSHALANFIGTLGQACPSGGSAVTRLYTQYTLRIQGDFLMLLALDN